MAVDARRTVAVMLLVLCLAPLCLALPGLPASGAAATTSAPTRALWVWSWDGARTLTDFATTQGFDRVYLYCQGGFDRSVKRTIAELTAADVSVEALGGERNWATSSRDGMLDFVRSAVRYQRHAPAAARLSGVHLDVEPYALRAWDRHQGKVKRSFLDALGDARRVAGRLPLAADIPFWYDGEGVRYQGHSQVLSLAVLRTVDAVSIMAYRDRAADVIDVARRELRQAGRLGKPVTVGVETGRTSPEYVTFYEEGRAALEAALMRVDDRLGRYRSFAGVAVHSYGSLATLGP